MSKYSFSLLCAVLFLAGSTVFTQTVECPPTLVCISREAALKALENAEKVKALEAESAVKDKAIVDYKELLNEMKIKFAEVSGENTVLRQTQVSDRAIMEVLLKNSRPKKVGLINIW